MAKRFGFKVAELGLLLLAGLMLFTPAASAQTATSTRELPPQVATDLRNALNLLSVSLGVLEVRMEQQQMVLANTGQQLGAVASQLTALQNPAVLDTKNERKIVSQILNIDAQLIGVMKTQVDLVKQEQSRQISIVSQLTTSFKTLTELIVKWKTSA